MKYQPTSRPATATEPLNPHPVIRWTEGGLAHSARWRSENGIPPHTRVVVADEQMSADTAYRLACEGTALLWRGDFQNARQMLQAMARRVDQKARKARDARAASTKNQKSQKSSRAKVSPASPSTPPPEIAAAAVAPIDAFNRHRLAQSQRARTLGMLLLPLSGDYTVPLRRAPDVEQACAEACGPRESGDTAGDSVMAMRELLGMIGAHEWRKKGVDVPALSDRVHPHYGVFAPVRGEYVSLVADTPLPSFPAGKQLAFDIGTGTGVLAAVLARRGIDRIVATDMDSRALTCARDNIRRLKLAAQVQVIEANLFPEGRAPLIVCNPPWIPARPSSSMEGAIYDPESRMLRGFLAGLAAHLEPGGEGWLIISDIAEHLGLRSRDELLAWIALSGLVVAERRDVRPGHPRVLDATDPLHAARAAEVTSLWRLIVKGSLDQAP